MVVFEATLRTKSKGPVELVVPVYLRTTARRRIFERPQFDSLLGTGICLGVYNESAGLFEKAKVSIHAPDGAG